MRTTRKNARQILVPDNGLVVFLYDARNAAELHERAPTLLGGFGESDLTDSALSQVVRDGLMVAYEKPQDDDTRIELVLGKPLSRAERGRAGLEGVEPVRTWLRLPAGKLRIEGYATLSIGPDRHSNSGRIGGLIDVPPGDYVLALYRAHSIGDHEEVGEPGGDVIVLTPLSQTTKPSPIPDFLRIRSPDEPKPSWVAAYRITGGVFSGLARMDPELEVPVVNMNPAAARQLGLEAGMVMTIAFQESNTPLRAVYLGDDASEALRTLREWQQREAEALFRTDWMRDSADSERDFIALYPLRPEVEQPQLANQWVAATVTVVT